MLGLPVIVMTRSAFDWPLRLLVVQVAFVPQMMSATVSLLPPAQAAWVSAALPGPELGVPGGLLHCPQLLSVTRMVAVGETDTPQAGAHAVSLNAISILSPPSRVFAKPLDEVKSAEVERRFVAAGVPPLTVMNT